MATQAKAALDTDELSVLADRGYFKSWACNLRRMLNLVGTKQLIEAEDRASDTL